MISTQSFARLTSGHQFTGSRVVRRSTVVAQRTQAGTAREKSLRLKGLIKDAARGGFVACRENPCADNALMRGECRALLSCFPVFLTIADLLTKHGD